MRLFLLNHNFLSQDLVFYGVFTGIVSILGYFIFILRLGRTIIYFNKRFYNLKQSIY